jgi:hypothetical protein
MATYLFTTLVVALFAVANARRPPFAAGAHQSVFLFATAVFLFVGFRENVGADWERYRDIYYYIALARFFSGTITTDVGFYLLNWAAAASSLGFYGVTALCAAVLAWGLAYFAKQTPYPWVALTIAMPHIVNVMAMDHIRQSTALGFSLLAMAYMLRGKHLTCVFLIVIACTFHKSAVFLLPLVVAASHKDNRVAIYMSSIAFTLVFYFFVLADATSVYEGRYITSEYGARAATIRLFQNIPPALIYLVVWRRLELRTEVGYFWLLLSFCALAFPLLLLVVPSSAAIDRLGKFIIPLQMFVYSQMLVLLGGNVLYRLCVVTMLCLYCLGYQGAWFYYSDIAEEFWIPYRTVLF